MHVRRAPDPDHRQPCDGTVLPPSGGRRVNSGLRRVRRLLSLEKPSSSTVRPAYDAIPAPRVSAEYTSDQPAAPAS